MGYYSELLDNMIKAGAFGFGKNTKWPDAIVEKLNEYLKETDNELEESDRLH